MMLLTTLLPAIAGADSLTAHQAARARLDAAIQAHGGAARLEALGALTVTFRGRRTMIGQSPAATTFSTEPNGWTVSLDPAKDRAAVEYDESYPGGYRFVHRQVVTPDASFVVNLDKTFDGNAIDRSPDPTATRAELARALPATLLLHARARGATLRAAAGDLVTFSEADGTVVGLRFGAGGLLTGYETLGDHGLLGDHLVAVEWSGWRDVAGVKTPGHLVEKRSGNPSREGDLTVDLGAPPADRFALPPGYVDAPAPPPPVRRLPGGVGVVRQGDGTNVMFVPLEGGVLVLEAPTSSALTEQTIARIEAETRLPIKWVAITHHHNDHANGLRAYIARGVTLLVSPSHKAYVEQLAAAPHTVVPDRLARAPRAPIIELVDKQRTVGDRVQLIPLGKTAHCDETLVFYLPKEKILYQGDNLIAPDSGDVPRQTSELTRALDRLIRERKLAVDTIVGTHGRLATPKDLASALAP